MSDTVEQPETPAPEPMTEAPAPVASPVDAVITQWELDCIHNSPASRDTDGFNHLVTTALPELRRRLKGL